jgi:hypothetical protein
MLPATLTFWVVLNTAVKNHSQDGVRLSTFIFTLELFLTRLLKPLQMTLKAAVKLRMGDVKNVMSKLESLKPVLSPS